MSKTIIPIPGSTGGQHWLAHFIDHSESYGPHVMRSFMTMIKPFRSVVDIGAGSGRDLSMAKSICPDATTIAVEFGNKYAKCLSGIADKVENLNIEKNKFPFYDESIDLFIANQSLEHTKEIFWIFHEVSRSLKIGGYFIIGVPNIASLHNRILLLFGYHPTQHKLYSAHVRPFSKKDTLKFFHVCFPGGYELSAFAGSQFYPFPASAARFLAKIFPEMSFSIYFMFKKLSTYKNEFLEFPVKAALETSFYQGEKQFN